MPELHRPRKQGGLYLLYVEELVSSYALKDGIDCDNEVVRSVAHPGAYTRRLAAAALPIHAITTYPILVTPICKSHCFPSGAARSVVLVRAGFDWLCYDAVGLSVPFRCHLVSLLLVTSGL